MTDLLCSVSSTLDAEICLRYWALDSAGHWVESLERISIAFDLTLAEAEGRVLAGSIARLFHVRCQACGTPYSVRTRGQFEEVQNLSGTGLLRCEQIVCQLRPRTLNAQVIAALISERTGLIWDTLLNLRKELRPIEHSRLSSLDAFYLYCVLLASGTEWQGEDLPSSMGLKVELAPTSLLAKTVYASLHTRGVLVPSVYSPTSAFNTGSTLDAPITFDVLCVFWTIAVDLDFSSRESALMRLWDSVASSDDELIENLQLVLTEHECLGVLLHRLDRSRIACPEPTASRLLLTIRHYLLDHSPSDVVDSIQLIFREAESKKRIQSAGEERLVAVVADALAVHMPRQHLSCAHSDKRRDAPSSLFKKSKFLVSREFYRLQRLKRTV